MHKDELFDNEYVYFPAHTLSMRNTCDNYIFMHVIMTSVGKDVFMALCLPVVW